MLFQSVSPDHTPSQTEMAYDFLLDKILSCEYLPQYLLTGYIQPSLFPSS